ncbi:hypothetical protein D1872_264230 [compost metagenome]
MTRRFVTLPGGVVSTGSVGFVGFVGFVGLVGLVGFVVLSVLNVTDSPLDSTGVPSELYTVFTT